MDPFSIGLAVASIVQFPRDLGRIIKLYYSDLYSELKESYGSFQASILLFTFPDASNAMASVRNNLFRASDHDGMLIKKSLADDCSMMAVGVRKSSQPNF